MDEKSIEAAKELVRTHSKVMHPEVEALRKVLHEELTITGTTLPHMELRTELERNNVEMIQEIIHLLPAITISTPSSKQPGQFNGYFSTDDPLEVEPLISSVMWLNYDGNYVITGERTVSYPYFSTMRPFYILGDNNEASPRKRRLILASPKVLDPNYMSLEDQEGFLKKTEPGAVFKYAPYNRRNIKKLDKIQSGFKKPITPDQINSMYDKNDKTLHVFSKWDMPLSFPVNSEKLLRLDSLSDEEISRYKIFDNISDLGLRFKVDEEIDEILSNYQQKARQAKITILGNDSTSEV